MHYCAEMRSAEITAKVAEWLRGRLQSDYYSSSNLDLGFAFFEEIFTCFPIFMDFEVLDSVSEASVFPIKPQLT